MPAILARVDPERGVPGTDFGRGFYTTTYECQAREWAMKAALKDRIRPGGNPKAKPAVVWFDVPLARLAPLHNLAFVRPEPGNVLFWAFVRHNRACTDPTVGDQTHNYGHRDGGTWYDTVSGPVAARWDRHWQVYLGYDQFSFHTRAAAAIFNELTRNPTDRGARFDWKTFPLRLKSGGRP